MSLRDAALLLLGHGSTVNADSSAPTYQQAEELRRRKIFAEVHVGFWKEEPNFRQSLRQTRRKRVFVVPNFISSGYFTEQVIPRELGLNGEVTRVGAQEVIYCEAVGQHPSMTEALLKRAHEIVAKSGTPITDPARSTCLFICGHGTSLNDNSTKIIHQQAETIRAQGIFADCQAVLMEQEPFVKDWRDLTPLPDVIVVPFFIADGLHSYEDIPVLLGLTPNVRERTFQNPHREGDRRLWYANAIGTEAFLADIIVTQAREAEARLPDDAGESAPSPAKPGIQEQLGRFLESHQAPWTMGQVVIHPGFQLQHAADELSAPLRNFHTLEELREVMRLDGGGQFRPLRAAPNLARGWRYHAPTLDDLHAALEYLYPAEWANFLLWREDALEATPWQETAERQTGRFRVVAKMDTAAVQELVAENCQSGCLKTRCWAPAAEATVRNATTIPLLCPEACNFLVSKARDKIKGPSEE